ncbi:outer membrane beta-barrel protein [Flammeovirga kamogawensis]|uniref:Porin family protein n=1 Tax=Flammeovirga kamogawensis TaxID=373891 RepID=A0ABX8H136_9BACT|nr:outer membrane beta-barrel protein [Flammeovirga kamogawensis]MBB6462425.1 hypothetical protein [Flammeovirga kamogawensis]QWG09536.1 porin family protein [Flammeovirga kamogawensis]TRX65052.1 porin family protein [Flammeovirga kamogawensis]
MKNYLLPILLFSFFTFSSIQFASAQSFKIGGGIGNTFADHKLTNISGSDFNVSDNALAWKVFAGVGKKFLGIEGGYRSLGKVKANDGGYDYESKITGWDVSLRGKIQIGPIFGFAKAGAFWAKYENSGSGVQQPGTENDTRLLWGVGAGIILAEKLELRLEWEAMDLSSDTHLSTLGLTTAVILGSND